MDAFRGAHEEEKKELQGRGAQRPIRRRHLSCSRPTAAVGRGGAEETSRGFADTVEMQRTRECGDLRLRGGRLNRQGLTVHDRQEGGRESRRQSSPAEGVTVTKAEEKRRGESP